MSLFEIDGIAFGCFVPQGGISRKHEIYSSQNEQFLHGNRLYDALCTYVSYSINVDTSNMNEEEYDALVEILSSPEDDHTFKFPYGQGDMTITGHIPNISDTFFRRERGGRSIWGDLTFEVVPTEPIRRAY